MYESFYEHFGLKRNPFHVSPDPNCFFSTPAHDAALGQLVFGIESRQGIMVLTGKPGTGKSTILQYLLEWLRQHNYSTSYVFHSMVPSVDLLELILQDFGIACPSRSMSDLLTTLHGWLLNRHRVGDCPAIIVDEAQALSTRALDELRMLLNLEGPGGKLVQLVLAGQPHLEKRLRQPELEQLRQRIMVHCKLSLLTLEETSGYIGFRLAGAGAPDGSMFPQETVQEVFRHSRGIPRVVNLLCEHGLLAACADHRASISPNDILQIARRFELSHEKERTNESPAGDIFSRLIPFPKLEPPVVASEPTESRKDWLSALAPSDPSLPTMPEGPVRRRGWRTSRERPKFVLYWREVQSAFVRDCRHFVRPVTTWLRAKPTGTGRRSSDTLRRTIVYLSSWLRQPLGSNGIATEHPRTSSASQKHF